VTTGPQPGSPPPPIDIISTQTLTSVKLKWKNPDYRDIIGYLIEANNLNKKGALEWQPVSQIKNGRQDRYELSFTHLAPSSQYTFRVMAMNEKGVSEPAYPDKVIGSPIIQTPSHLELRARMPYYRESWFVILCACLSVVITIMVIAVLCVRNKTYKYKQEAKKGSQDRLSEVGFGLDDNIENHYPTGFEMRQHNALSSQQRRSNGTLSTTVSLAATKSPPRPSPGSITYSDDEEDDDDDDIKGAGIYESSGESLTEKPSEMSSSGPESESEHDDASAANHFVNHYANVNDTLRKGQQSWKRHAKPYVVPTHHRLSMPSRPAPPAPPPPSYLAAIAINASEDSELDSPSVNLNGGRIIVNNMAGSRAPLPGFSSFV
jgi:protein sidekick